MRHRKFELSLVFGQKYIYEGIWRGDEDRHLDWARRASLHGENVILVSKINKYDFLYIILLLKINVILSYIYAFFGKITKKKPERIKFVSSLQWPQYLFSKHRPSGPMLSISQNVRLSVGPCVRLCVHF